MPPWPEAATRPAWPKPQPGHGELPAYLRALWQLVPRLAVLAPRHAAEDEGAPPQRAVLHRGEPAAGHRPAVPPSIHLPAVWSEAADGGRLKRAAVAHLAAHLVHGHAAQARGQLKPIQLVLLGLLEDARVEWLASQELPGLRGLWLPFHLADAGSGNTFEALLQRLARCLLDPGWRDPHPWVHKARRMFYADESGSGIALHTAEDLRRAASLLGNDVGQMRLPFNAGLYAVEPAYRDDNSHLWAFDAALPPSAVPLDGEQAAPERGASAQGSGQAAATTPAARSDGEPPPAAPEVRVSPRAGARDDVAPPVAAASPQQAADPASADERVRCSRYPEWDRLIARYRVQWCSVYEDDAPAGDPRACAALLARHAGLVAQARRALLAAGLRGGQPGRPVQAAEGETFHLGRLVEARIAQRLRRTPDPRVHLRAARRQETLAVLVLLDTSASTADALAGGGTVLDAIRGAALVAAAALEGAGHWCALQAFSSNTRAMVRVQRVKAFGEDIGDAAVQARLAGLRSGGSTRLGAVVRHAGAQLRRMAAQRPLVLLLSDGQAHDVDIHDSRYLAEDLRRACGELARGGAAVASIDAASGSRDTLLARLPQVLVSSLAALPT